MMKPEKDGLPDANEAVIVQIVTVTSLEGKDD